MIKLKIDNRDVEVADGATILDAAEKLDIDIPTMCFRKDCKPFTSCMICMVKENSSGKLLPACSALAQDGMDISTSSEEVQASRRTALELLLSDHTGDCEGPCQRVCPAGINIPLMLRSIISGDTDKAASIVAAAAGDGVNPCDDCKCPCEKACRRRQHDEWVGIKLLVSFAMNNDKASDSGQRTVDSGEKFDFNCSMGRLQEGEMDEFLKHASPAPRLEPASGSFTAEEAAAESARCLHCDCLKHDNCLLRKYSDSYSARQRQYASSDRQRFTQLRKHANVVYEPGKCIKCGLCVQITERETEKLGLSFIGRGFDVKVGVPFSKEMDEALTTAADQCVRACPTAALAFRDDA